MRNLRWCALALLAACSSGTSGDSGTTDDANAVVDPYGGGKGDVAVDPIVALDCQAQNSFVEIGGFVEVDVDARDAQGRQSRNYTLEVTPNAAARVVQRNKVIFDEAGAFDIRCKSNDSTHKDTTSVMVGYTEPALAVNAPLFVEGNRVRITGRAVGADDAPVFIEIDGAFPALGEDGSFDVTMPAQMGRLNRYHFTATDNTGRSSDRNVFVIAGQYGDLQVPTADAVRVSMGPQVYPDLASLVERVIRGLPEGQTERSDNLTFEDLLKPESGSNLGIDWTFDPISLGSTPPNVTLTPVANGIEVNVVLDEVVLLANVLTGDPPDQNQRDLTATVTNAVVSGVLRVNGPDDLGVQNVGVEWDDLDVDLTGFPNFVLDLFLVFFEGKFKDMIAAGIEKAGNKGLIGVLDGFGVSKSFDLPAPLLTTLTTSSTVSTLQATQNGLDIGLSFGIDGDTDPLRADVPGPLRFDQSATTFTTHDAYQVALALEPINDLLFATWQTGALDVVLDQEQGISTHPSAPQVESVIAFVEPALPPVLAPTGTPGVFQFEFGGIRVDAVFDTTLGMANTAVIAGGTATITLTGDAQQFTADVALGDVWVDVLVAPFTFEREAVENYMEAELLPKLFPKIAGVVAHLPIPEADLAGLEVGLSTLAVENLTITTSAPNAALSVRTDIVIR